MQTGSLPSRLESVAELMLLQTSGYRSAEAIPWPWRVPAIPFAPPARSMVISFISHVVAVQGKRELMKDEIFNPSVVCSLPALRTSQCMPIPNNASLPIFSLTVEIGTAAIPPQLGNQIPTHTYPYKLHAGPELLLRAVREQSFQAALLVGSPFQGFPSRSCFRITPLGQHHNLAALFSERRKTCAPPRPTLAAASFLAPSWGWETSSHRV
ncbi:hypothetical protein BJ166DRAFT_305651 [Pestalotiopsis sp. NC0098]|nr:hypothetical protein BJ166DRAFT_305651 [Pestalotiopsis sp. NC0098]